MKSCVKSNLTYSIHALLICLILVGCGPLGETDYKVTAMEDSISGKLGLVGTQSGGRLNNPPKRQFIRTANIKFRVKDVVVATSKIEAITRQQGGFVTSTELNSNVESINTMAISADSSLESTQYQVSNQITLRIPNVNLDSTLMTILESVEFLDSRNIKAEDVALQILSNDLTQKRLTKNAERVEGDIDRKGKKLNESTLAEELLIDRQEKADVAGLNNLTLADQVNYSTITLWLYERPALKREIISNPKNIDAYELALGLKLMEAFKTGWQVLEAGIVFVARLWFLILFGAIFYFVMRWKRQKIQTPAINR